MRSRTLISTSIVTAAVSLLVAACGGSSPATGASGQSGLVAYSRCMRSHGFPTFPDPTSSQGIPKDRIPIGNPRFSPASDACHHLMPASGLGPQTTPQRLITTASVSSFVAGH